MDATWLKYLPRFIGKWLSGRHELQSALGNSGWLISDRVLRMGVGMAVGVWLARYLGPDYYGQLSYAIGFASLFSAFAHLGMNSIVVRNLVRTPDQKGVIISSALFLKLCGGSLAFLLSLGWVIVLRPGDETDHLLVGIIAAAMIFQASDVVELWFQSQIQSKYPVWSKGAAFLITSMVKVWLILNHAKLIAFAWVFLSEFALAAIILAVVFRGTGNVIKIQWRWPQQAGQLFRESWSLMLSGMAIMLYMRLDIVMLREMKGEHAAGIYAAATNISEAGYFLPAVIVASAFPAIVKYRVTNHDAYINSLRKLYFVMFWLAVGLVLPMSLLAAPITDLVYGTQFHESGHVLAIHLWASIAVFLSVASSHYLVAESLQKIAFLRSLFGAASNLIFNLILIPIYGAIGAAVATVLSYAIVIVSLWVFKDTRGHIKLMTRSIYRIMS